MILQTESTLHDRNYSTGQQSFYRTAIILQDSNHSTGQKSFYRTENILQDRKYYRKMIKNFSAIENKIGSDKIFSKFLVATTNTHDSITEQFIHCVVKQSRIES